jgi:hypothetical protein
LKITKVEEELKRVKNESMLNIQSLAISLLFHSSSSLECVEGKVSNEKIQFAQTIIHNINMIESSIVEFMRKSKIRWCVRG